jgi:cytoskeletal protein CcmA (bactofilin family)
VKGRFDGKVSCESFILRASSEVKADVNTAGLVIESGARIEGRFTKPKA